MRLPHTLSHAYLITGGNASSRADCARELAAAYLCTGERPPCGSCLPCRKVAAGIHPDVVYITPLEDKREISVEQARSLRSDAYVRPNEGKRKVYIIDPAEAMNQAAQNALLKVLEEGPPYAAFLLLAGQPGMLLDTIHSRCEQFALSPQEGQRDPELEEKGVKLARLLLAGDELAAAENMAALEGEKLKGTQLAQLLGAAEEEAARALAQRPGRAAAVVRALKRCQENAVYNPGAGHVLGWLTATLFS